MNLTLSLTLPKNISIFFQKHTFLMLGIILSLISIGSFIFYFSNGLGLAYSDARSHLDIGRRVVENLQPGFAQLGSVWLPLTHILMLVTVWNDFMWHSGLAGALPSMVAYVATSMLIYSLLKKFGVSMLGRMVGVGIFALNINVFYMQATAMTELALLGTMTAGVYELILWHRENTLFRLIKSAFWIMLSTLIRYDGWFLLAFAAGLVFIHSVRRDGYKTGEGVLILFGTLSGFGVFLWLLWNQIIFHDALYFALGPYSAHAQQLQLGAAGNLLTKHDVFLSTKAYLAAMIYNTSLPIVLLSIIGMVFVWFDKKIPSAVRIATIAFVSPLFFNIIALYFGYSALFVKGVHPIPEGWFNVRYGIMMIPSCAFFIGYLIDRIKNFKAVAIGILCFFTFISFVNQDAVALDDAYSGVKSANVENITTWLHKNTSDKNGYILISAAAHDGVIFSSGLPMKKYIHEGIGAYWNLGVNHPDKYVRWIVMEPNTLNDATTKAMIPNHIFKEKYREVQRSAFVYIYELKPEYVADLQPLPMLQRTNKGL